MPYRLVALDLHGTLLEEDFTVNPLVAERIRGAAAHGVQFALATGMTPESARVVAEALGIPAHILAFSGALVLPAGELPLLHWTLDPADVCRAIALTAELPLVRILVLDDAIYGDGSERAVAGMARTLNVVIVPTADLAGQVRGNPTMFMVGAWEPPVIDECVARLAKPHSRGLQMLHPRASKDQSLVALCAHLGIPVSETLAMGDTANDADMIRAAGLGAAVANATPELCAEADYVCERERGFGVAEALARFVLREPE